MSDLVVTVPKDAWVNWINEGDAVGDPDTGVEWSFCLGGARPRIEPGERLYIVAWGLLRGYAPVTRVIPTDRGWGICRRGGAVAVTIETPVPGFRGWRVREWSREAEKPFPDWLTAGLPPRERAVVERLAGQRAADAAELAALRANYTSRRPAAQREQG